VADASSLVDYLAAGSPLNVNAPHLRSADLHVPAICDVEVFSAFRRAALAGTIDAVTLANLLADYAELPLHRHWHLPLIGRAFELRDNVAAADAFYVALAERLQASLLTADRRLARAVRQHTAVPVLP
jgi:predicted nucleic acid-binding protein